MKLRTNANTIEVILLDMIQFLPAQLAV